MNAKKIVVILIALLAGGGAFYLAMSGTDSPVPIQVPIVQAPKEKTVKVLVANADIERGGRLNAENMKWTEWPEKVVSDGFSYITDENPEAMEELTNAVARSSFVIGEPLLETKIVRVGSGGQMAAILTPGMRAIGLRVSPETASGGFILPGDRVDVIFTGEERDTRERLVNTLLYDKRVLAVNEIFSENPETPVISGVNVTLEVTPAEAESFVFFRASGELSLALRSIFEKGIAPEPKKEEETEPEPVSTPKKVRVIRVGRS